MKITNKIIEQHGFKRINNSMFRRGELTLQNICIHKCANVNKAYKACFKGRFVGTIEDEQRLNHLIRMYGENY